MFEQILQNLNSFRPELILAVTLCVAIIADLLFRKQTLMLPAITLIGIGAALVAVCDQSHAPMATLFSKMYAVDPFSIFFKALILVSGFFIVIFSTQSGELNTGKRKLGEYYALLIAILLGMVLMTGSTSLLMMYLSLELTSITSYILSGFMKESDNSSEASLKYVLYGAVSSGLMLYGMSMLYGLTGSMDLYGINQALVSGNVSVVALTISGILIVAGFGYKISAVPFHFWTPDVYEGSPITITAILSVASKAAGFAMMIRFFKVAFVDPASAGMVAGSWSIVKGFEWNYLLAIISVITMTIGNLVAVWQNNLKRMLAYSSIAHAGYMLLGVVVLTNEGIAAVLVYFVVYMFMNLGAFYAVMIVANKVGSEDIEQYKGLGYRSPLIGVAMTIFLLSLTGIPPTAGFVGKLYLFAALIGSQWIWLAVVAAVNSVISLYYYVRILRNMFLRDPEGGQHAIEFSPLQVVVLIVLVLPTVVLGLYFGPLVEYAQASISMFGVM